LALGSLFSHLTPGESQRRAGCGPATIRRARDYIHAHVAEPIELARLAKNLGVGIRALQENFQRFYGVSPRNYIFECRLETARVQLLAQARGFLPKSTIKQAITQPKQPLHPNLRVNSM